MVDNNLTAALNELRHFESRYDVCDHVEYEIIPAIDGNPAAQRDLGKFIAMEDMSTPVALEIMYALCDFCINIQSERLLVSLITFLKAEETFLAVASCKTIEKCSAKGHSVISKFLVNNPDHPHRAALEIIHREHKNQQ